MSSTATAERLPFTADEIDQALIDFANRERRFGKTK